MELRRVLLLLFAFYTCSVALNPIRLGNSKLTPYHYNVELVIDVVSKHFSVEERIELWIGEDLKELQINENELDGKWLTSRLVNQETGVEYIPYSAYSMYDNTNEILRLMFDKVVPGRANYTLQLTGISGKFKRAFNEFNLGSNR